MKPNVSAVPRLLGGLFAVSLASSLLAGPAWAATDQGFPSASMPLPAKAKVCPEKASRRAIFYVQNLLSTPVILTTANVDCDSWSNTGNPTNINGLQLAPLGHVANLAWEEGYRWELAWVPGRATWSLGIDGGEFGTGMGQVSLEWVRRPNRSQVVLKVVGGGETGEGRQACYSRRLNFTNAPRTKYFPPPQNHPQIQIYSDGERIVVRTCQTLDPASQV